MIAASGRAVCIGRLIGWTAVAASLGFVGLQLWQHAPWRLANEHLEVLTVAVVGGALVYGVAGFLLSSAWYQLLGAGSASAPVRCHHAVYGRTQIAKYLPGNVFHLVGRQLLGRRLGHGQARLALASLLEGLLLALTAALLSLPLLWGWLDQGLFWTGAALAVMLVLIAARGRRLFPKLLDFVVGEGSRALVLSVLRAAALYVVFFLLVAVIFWMLALSVSEPGGPTLALVGTVPVVALSWLAGFATPGSSAGIGIREAVLIAALEGSLGAPASALIALGLRLVTFGGDVVFLALALSLGLSSDCPHRPRPADDISSAAA